MWRRRCFSGLPVDMTPGKRTRMSQLTVSTALKFKALKESNLLAAPIPAGCPLKWKHTGVSCVTWAVWKQYAEQTQRQIEPHAHIKTGTG